MKHLLAITIALLPTAALAQQFTPKQMLDAMTKSPENRDVRVHDFPVLIVYPDYVGSRQNGDVFDSVDAPYLKGFLLRGVPVQKYKVP
jgi:hypothetical protein